MKRLVARASDEGPSKVTKHLGHSMERHSRMMASPGQSLLVPFLLMVPLIGTPHVHGYTLITGRASEDVFKQCHDSEVKASVYCFGTVAVNNNLKLSKIQEADGCIELSTCTFLMVIENQVSSIQWKAYQLSDASTVQSSGRFEAAFRQDKVTTNNCRPMKGDTHPTGDWPDGTLVFTGGDGNGAKPSFNQKVQSQVMDPGRAAQTDTGTSKIYNKYTWTTGTTFVDGGKKLELGKAKAVAFAVRIWSTPSSGATGGNTGTSKYDGCIDFGDRIFIFEDKKPAFYGNPSGNKRKDDEGEKSSLLWLWILLALLLLLLLLALLIWCCCCRKKDTVEKQTTTAPTSASTAPEPAPASAAPASAVPSNKPSSVVAPKSSAKPGGSTVGATPPGASTSMRSAYTNVPSGQSTASSNVSARSKMTSLHSNSQSKTGSKVGSSSSKVPSKTASSSPSSSSNKSATSK